MTEKKRFFLLLFTFLCLVSGMKAVALSTPPENQRQEQPLNESTECTEESCGEEALPGASPELVSITKVQDYRPKELRHTFTESSVETPPPEI